MAKSKRFTPEQNMVLVEIEKIYGKDWDAVKEAKKTKNFLRIPDRTIQQKLYRIWRERTGQDKTAHIVDSNGNIDNSHPVTSVEFPTKKGHRIPVTGYIEGDELVVTYTIRVKLPK